MRGAGGFFRGLLHPLPDDALTAWGVLMKTFPGSFPANVFDALDLDRYGETWSLAVEFQEAEAEAMRQAREHKDT